MCQRLPGSFQTQHRTINLPLRMLSKLNSPLSASPWQKQTIGRTTASSYRQDHGIRSPAASASNQQVRRQQSIGSSAMSANSHLRSTHSCRMSGSRRGRLHTQHNTMRTITHHFNSSTPHNQLSRMRSLTHSYRQVRGVLEQSARSSASARNQQPRIIDSDI